MSKKSEKKSSGFHQKIKAYFPLQVKRAKAKKARNISPSQEKTSKAMAGSPSKETLRPSFSHDADPLFPGLLSLRRKKPFVYLFAIDPYSLYAYWIIDQKELRGAWKNQWVLRLVKNDSIVESESPLELKTQKKYYFQAKPNTSYHAEIGFYSLPRKNFCLVARSADAITPPDTFSEKKEIKLAHLPLELSFKELLPSAQAKAIAKDELAEAFVLSEQQAQNLYPEMPLPGQDGQEEEGFFYSSTLIEDILCIENQSFGSAHNVAFSPHQANLFQHKNTSYWKSLANEVEKYSAFDLSWITPLTSAVSSSMGIDNTNPNDFPLEIEVELILRGKTLPKAVINIDGKEIKLNEDGAFALCIRLPEGIHEIPIEAMSREIKRSKKVVLFYSHFSHLISQPIE
ncbi:DUF4912 domain-containing protein [Candidatus Methylacidiphilum infernorum]|uniref:Uncharacterized conserved protein n=1 Tax=Methylacidiphilum infernorum (isolate V4) TaxID=481448 RepID=B3DWC9_METI4|nr:DUF4912 domain-containing protein [Candidatus Methylacidiphilum infernorum]ACD83632.1 Uncharacterized conserved protein [Methylacidiphilum infernorum V4]